MVVSTWVTLNDSISVAGKTDMKYQDKYISVHRRDISLSPDLC